MTLNFQFCRRIRHIVRPAACAGLSFIYFFTNVLCLYAGQSNFWTERKAAVKKLQNQSNFTETLRSLSHAVPEQHPRTNMSPEQSKLLAQLPQTAKLDLGVSENIHTDPTNIPSFSIGGEALSSFRKGGLGRIINNPPQSPFNKGEDRGITPTLFNQILPYGDIRDVYVSRNPNSPLIIHIQDVHQVEEAQKNIANIIQEITKAQNSKSEILNPKQIQMTEIPNSKQHNERYDAMNATNYVVVGVEGATGPFNLEPYREYTGPVIAKAIAGYLLKEGYIGGPEFAGLTAPEPPLLWGVENKQLYDNNVQAFKDSLKYKPQVEALLGQLKATAEGLKEHIYSKELKEFDSHFNAYKNDKEKLGEYVRYLIKTSSSFPLPVGEGGGEGKRRQSLSSLSLFPNLNLLLQALNLEEHLDFNKVDQERQELVTLMVKQLSEKQLDHLLKQSLTYRMGGMSYSQYYEFLRSFCHKNQVPFDTFSQLKSYVTYVKVAERINRNKLFDELTSVEENAQNLLATTTEQKRLVTISRNLMLLEKLTSHQMTPEDWNYYEKHREQIFQSLSFPQFVSGNPVPLKIKFLLTPFEDFCRHAMERNTALVDNLLLKVQQSSNPPSSPFSKGGKKGITLSNSTLASTSVLIAGGFHSDGLTQILKAKDISYIVVTPKITEVPKDTHYLDVFAHDPTPLEKLFTGEVISLSPHLVFNGINHDDLRGQIAHGLGAGLYIPAKMVGKDRELKEVTASKQIKEEFITTLQKEAVNVAGSLGFESITVDDFIWESGYFVGALVTVTTGGKTISFWSFMTEGEKLDAFENSIRKQGKEIETKRIVAEGKLDINGEVGFHIYNANRPVPNSKQISVLYGLQKFLTAQLENAGKPPATVRSFVNNKYLRHAIAIHEGAAWLLARILSPWTKTKPEKIQIRGSKPGVLIPGIEQHPVANFIVSLGHPLVNLALAFVPFAVAYFYGLPDTVTWQAFWAVYLLTMSVPNAIVGGYNLIIYRITGSDGWRVLHPGTTPPTPWIKDMNSVFDRVKIGLNWLANIVPGLNVINISTRTDDSKIIRMMLHLLENISGASGMNTPQFWVQYGAFAHHEAYRAAELYVEAHNAVVSEHGSIRTDGKYLKLVLSKLGEKLQEHALDLVTPKIPQGQQIIQIKEPRLLDLLLGRWIFDLGRLKAIQIPKPDQSVNNVDGLAQEVLGDEDAPDVKRMFIEILGQIKNDNISLVSSDKKSKTWDKESLRRLLLFVRDVLEVLNEVPEGILNKSSRKMPLTIESLQFHGMIGRGGVIKISVKPHEAGKRGIVIDVGSDGVTDKTELRDTVIHETLGHKLTFMDNRDVLDDFVLPLRSWMGIAQLIVGESLARSFTTDFVKRNTDLLEKTGKADSLFVKVTEAIAYALTDHAESPYVRGMDRESKFKEIRTVLSSDLLVDKHGKHWEFIGGRNGGWREVTLIKPSEGKPGSGRQNSLRQQAYELLRQHMQYVVRYNEGYSNASIDDWRMVLRALKQYRPNFRLDIQELLTNEMLLQEFVNTFYKVFKEAKNITGDPYVDSTINHRKMLELLEKQQGAPSRNGWVDFDPIFRLLDVTNQVHRKVISSVIEALGLNIPVAEGWISKLAGMPILLPLEVHKEVLEAVGFVVSGAHEIPQGLKDEIPDLEGAITNAIDKANKDFGITISANDIQIIRSPPSKSGGLVGKISGFLTRGKSNVVNGLKDVPTHELLFWTTDGKIMIHEDVLVQWQKDGKNLATEFTKTIIHERHEYQRYQEALDLEPGESITRNQVDLWHNEAEWLEHLMDRVGSSEIKIRLDGRNNTTYATVQSIAIEGGTLEVALQDERSGKAYRHTVTIADAFADNYQHPGVKSIFERVKQLTNSDIFLPGRVLNYLAKHIHIQRGKFSETEIFEDLLKEVRSQQYMLSRQIETTNAQRLIIDDMQSTLQNYIESLGLTYHLLNVVFVPGHLFSLGKHGFYFEFFKTIVLPSDINEDKLRITLLHEYLHGNSYGFAQKKFDESMTNYLMVKLLMAKEGYEDYSYQSVLTFYRDHVLMTLMKDTDTKQRYEDKLVEMIVMLSLINMVGEEPLLEAYFSGDQSHLQALLGSHWEFIEDHAELYGHLDSIESDSRYLKTVVHVLADVEHNIKQFKPKLGIPENYLGISPHILNQAIQSYQSVPYLQSQPSSVESKAKPFSLIGRGIATVLFAGAVYFFASLFGVDLSVLGSWETPAEFLLYGLLSVLTAYSVLGVFITGIGEAGGLILWGAASWFTEPLLGGYRNRELSVIPKLEYIDFTHHRADEEIFVMLQEFREQNNVKIHIGNLSGFGRLAKTSHNPYSEEITVTIPPWFLAKSSNFWFNYYRKIILFIVLLHEKQRILLYRFSFSLSYRFPRLSRTLNIVQSSLIYFAKPATILFFNYFSKLLTGSSITLDQAPHSQILSRDGNFFSLNIFSARERVQSILERVKQETNNDISLSVRSLNMYAVALLKGTSEKRIYEFILKQIGARQYMLPRQVETTRAQRLIIDDVQSTLQNYTESLGLTYHSLNVVFIPSDIMYHPNSIRPYLEFSYEGNTILFPSDINEDKLRILLLREGLNRNSYGFVQERLDKGMTDYLLVKLLMAKEGYGNFYDEFVMQFFENVLPLYENKVLKILSDGERYEGNIFELSAIISLVDVIGEEPLLKVYFRDNHTHLQALSGLGWKSIVNIAQMYEDLRESRQRKEYMDKVITVANAIRNHPFPGWTMSLFGEFGLKSVVMAAVRGDVDREVLITALESAKNMVKDNGAAHGFFDNLLESMKSGNVTPKQIMWRLLKAPSETFLILPSELFEIIMKAAGFAFDNLVVAAGKDSLYQEAKDVVEQFQEKVGTDVKPENIHIVRGPPVKGLDNKKFVTFAPDAKGALHVYIHKDTLRDWEREERRFTNNPPQPSFKKVGEKGSGYLRNALAMALWHETLENRGVSHDDLANMGFTIDALNEMYKVGLTAEQIHAEIMRRGMMELSHAVKVEMKTSPSVSKKEKAEKILQALIRGKHPQPLLTHTVNIGGVIVALDGERKAQKERFLNFARTVGEPDAKTKVERNDAEIRQYNNFLRAVDYMDAEELSEVTIMALAEQSSEAKSDFRQELAQSLARDITNALDITNNEEELIPLIKRVSAKLGLLHALGGSLFQGNIMEKKKSLSLEERALNQQRDLALISQIPFLAGHLDASTDDKRENATGKLSKWMNSYNEVRHRVVRINSAYQFLDASLAASSNGIVVQVSKNMLEAKGELSGVEQTGLNLLIGHANRLDENGNLLAGRNITLVLKDDEGKGMSTEAILNALNKRVANSGIKSDLTRLSSLAGSLIVNDQSPLMSDGKISIKGLIKLLRKERRLKDNQGLDIFALNEKDWARDVTEKEAIVNLIVMLAGNLAHVITPIETEGRKQTYLKIQA